MRATLLVFVFLCMCRHSNSQAVLGTIHLDSSAALYSEQFVLEDGVLNADENILFVTHNLGYNRVEVGPGGELTWSGGVMIDPDLQPKEVIFVDTEEYSSKLNSVDENSLIEATNNGSEYGLLYSKFDTRWNTLRREWCL